MAIYWGINKLNSECDEVIYVKKVVILLIIVTLVSKVLGFFKDLVLSYFYGASPISDAYIISMTIPLFIIAFIGTGISTCYIPMYNEIYSRKGMDNSNKYTSNVVNIMLIIFTIIFIVVMLFTKQVVLAFASGFERQTLELAVLFTRIGLVSIFFSGLAFVFNGYLQIKDNFLIPGIATIPLNIIIIISIYLSTVIEVKVLAIGTVIAMASQFFFLLPSISKTGYKHRYFIDLKDEDIKLMGYMLLPVIIGASVNQINVLVDRTLASQLAVGGISALTYAKKLIYFVQGIFATSIATVMFPQISKLASDNKMVDFKKVISEGLTAINIFLVPVTLGAMLFSEPIVVLLFGRGAFDEQAISMTSSALFFYSIGILGIGLREVLSRGFYSLKDTKTPMINAGISVVINIILNFILSKYLGIGGLALATSIAATLTMVLMFISLRKKAGPLGMKQISISFLKILFASLVMGLLAKLSFNYLIGSLSQNISLLMATGVGAVSYFVLIYFMKIEDVDVIVGAIKKKFGKKLV